MRHAVATVILALLILLAWWCSAEREPPTRADENASRETSVAQEAPGPARTDAADEVSVVAPGVLEAVERTSLAGTSVDGTLTLVNGRFVPDRQALRMFDYFLSTEGELSPAEIRALVEREARARVPSDQVAAVMELFDEYLRYRRESGELAERSTADSYFEELKALQSSIFGDDAMALFGRDNRMAEYAIARKEIATDPELSVIEKNARLAELETTLPEPLREARAVLNRHTEVSNIVEQMRRDGLSEEDVFEYRADEFGEAAAERLTELDSSRAAWEKRLDAYRDERDELWALQLDPGAEEHALERLREEHFEGPEIIRVRSLDKRDGAQEQ